MKNTVPAMNQHIEQILAAYTVDAVRALYGQEISPELVSWQETRKEFEGDYTLVVFPLLKISHAAPDATAAAIGGYLAEHCPVAGEYNIIKGFLNLSIRDRFWFDFVNTSLSDASFGISDPKEDARTIMIEYSSPNTNKPLHLGHVRNNLLGFSLARILAANGNRVIKVNLVNDRGIHICKSMLAWQRFGNGETPESTGLKGDHLVGNYYVRFDVEYKKEVKALEAQGMTEEEAAAKAPLLQEAQAMLRRWEARDPETIALWETMNRWVYDGFDDTYRKLGVSFDKVYYESETYLLGKEIVRRGLDEGIFYRKENGSVWCDLTKDGLDEKLLLRADGTSVYMTQDIGTACQRFSTYNIDEHIYVVGNEQNYHFQVLSLILGKLGYSWASHIHHLSYGMVELPNGRMKSREGTVVDADDLMDDMIDTARGMSETAGKLEGYTRQQAEDIYRIIGLGALKYFILKVDPRKNMMFSPEESIDFNGNTGPFIQYTYARIRSILRKAAEDGMEVPGSMAEPCTLNAKEKSVIKILYGFPDAVKAAGDALNPSVIAAYVYDLAKEFNQFYHDFSILHEPQQAVRSFRLMLSLKTAWIIRSGMSLLGIEVPERM